MAATLQPGVSHAGQGLVRRRYTYLEGWLKMKPGCDWRSIVSGARMRTRRLTWTP